MKCTTYVLPESKEDDQLDTQDLQERSVWGQVIFQLNIELNETEHGDRDRKSFKSLDPDVRKCRAVRLGTITTYGLRNDRDNREENSDEAVLEDRKIDDL